MKLKYRIKFVYFNDTLINPIYIAQYKIFGLWLNINDRQIGRFSTPVTCYCETVDVAKERIRIHKENSKRAKNWYIKSSYIIPKENN